MHQSGTSLCDFNRIRVRGSCLVYFRKTQLSSFDLRLINGLANRLNKFIFAKIAYNFDMTIF